jgi:sporulation protein YlmC with PRC-barrel domain
MGSGFVDATRTKARGVATMDVPLNVEVSCSDGACGRSTVIIVDPKTQRVTHVVVQDEGNEYLVPIGAISDSSATHIRLSWSVAELRQAESFIQEVPADEEHLDMMSNAMVSSSVFGPYTSPDAAYMVDALGDATMEQELVPANEMAIHQDARVEAIDGTVGEVEEFIIDPETNEISHLVLRKGHFWGERDVSVPVNEIDRVEDDVVYLKLDRKSVGHLPAVRAPKK